MIKKIDVEIYRGSLMMAQEEEGMYSTDFLADGYHYIDIIVSPSISLLSLFDRLQTESGENILTETSGLILI
jgi:hypothetical protein